MPEEVRGESEGREGEPSSAKAIAIDSGSNCAKRNRAPGGLDATRPSGSQPHQDEERRQMKASKKKEISVGKVNPADKIEQWELDKLTPYARNSRTHSDEQVAQLAASIREWGWTTPVLVDEDGGIIAGHGRVLAARQLGMAKVPVVVAEGWSEAKRRAYVIADNKLAQNAGWDTELLALELGELGELGFDLDLTGFSGDEIKSFKLPSFDPASEDDQGKLDELAPKFVTCPHCEREFDARKA